MVEEKGRERRDLLDMIEGVLEPITTMISSMEKVENGNCECCDTPAGLFIYMCVCCEIFVFKKTHNFFFSHILFFPSFFFL